MGAVELCHFDILGDPAAQGSKKAWVNPATGRAQMREQAGAKLSDWRSTCAAAAYAIGTSKREWIDETAGHRKPDSPAVPFDGALILEVTFRFSVPAKRRRQCKAAGGILPKVTAPDLDKLVRALGDSLKAGGLIVDDARLCSFTNCHKVEVDGWTGAVVTLRRWEP